MPDRRGFFRACLAGLAAVVGIKVKPQQPALAFHPNAFQFATWLLTDGHHASRFDTLYGYAIRQPLAKFSDESDNA